MKKVGADKKKFKIIGLIIAILLIGALVFVKYVPQETPKAISDTFYFEIDKNVTDEREAESREEIEAELNKKVADSMINISMNLSPKFQNGNSAGNLEIVNEKINKYPQIVEIYRNDTNELIYKSGGIPVGNKIKEAKLDVVLVKGTYKCTAYFNAVNSETKELVGRAGAKIEIIVLN